MSVGGYGWINRYMSCMEVSWEERDRQSVFKHHNPSLRVTGYTTEAVWFHESFQIAGHSGLICGSCVEMFAFANIFYCLSRQSFQHPTFNMLKSQILLLVLWEYANAAAAFKHNERMSIQLGCFVREDNQNVGPCDAPISLSRTCQSHLVLVWPPLFQLVWVQVLQFKWYTGH